MPLHTVLAPRRLRIGSAAAIAAVVIGAGAPAIAGADDDIEANKATSMRALSRHTMAHHRTRSPALVDAAAHAATIRAIGARLAR